MNFPTAKKENSEEKEIVDFAAILTGRGSTSGRYSGYGFSNLSIKR
jgi:hypothetical protein